MAETTMISIYKNEIEEFDKYVADYHQKADDMKSIVANALNVLIIVLIIIVIPDVASRVSEHAKEIVEKENLEIPIAIKQYEQEYKIKFYEIEKLSENPSTQEKKAREITSKIESKSFYTSMYFFTSIMSYFKQQEKSISILATAIPLVFGSILVGSLLSYRFLIQKAYELNIKKYDFILELEKLKVSKLTFNTNQLDHNNTPHCQEEIS